jgi:hypothetical protein
LRIAVVADVFVDGHARFLFVDGVIIAIFDVAGERLETTEKTSPEFTEIRTQRGGGNGEAEERNQVK